MVTILFGARGNNKSNETHFQTQNYFFSVVCKDSSRLLALISPGNRRDAVIIPIPIPLGLDLQGGSQLTIQVKPSSDKQITERELEAVQKEVTENRINSVALSGQWICRQ